jgi:HD-GYP domain-containing protein (c-di-GMP phosphodiesterase class II)
LNAQSSLSLRQAEVVAALSMATDLGTGQPLERALRTCLLAFRLGECAGISAEELRTVYYVTLLRFVGCTADARHLMDIFGDELLAQTRVSTVELMPIPMLLAMIRYAGEGFPLPERLQKLTYGLKSGIARTRVAQVAHCEVSQNIAQQCGLGEDVQLALGQIFERWDGRGTPGLVKTEALSKAIRLVHIAQDAEVFYRAGDAETAVRALKKRSGGAYDPALVNCFAGNSPALFSELDSASIWEVILGMEPSPHLYLSEAQLEQALAAIADFTDLRSPYTYHHSGAVAQLAFNAAQRCGLPHTDAVDLRYAGYLHDVGRIAVPLSVWDKSGTLTSLELDRVRLYPYYTERIFARSPRLAPLGALAALHRERLDGTGYHRGLPASLLSLNARVLAAADVYQSKIEPRAYRSALTTEAAADELLDQVRSGKLDKQAVAAVLEGATGKRVPGRRVGVANLSDREVEVLRLIARGLSTPKIAVYLGIAPKTADHHVQHIYTKIGVSTRAAATLFAMQNGLLSESISGE